MTVEQEAEYLKVHPDYIAILVPKVEKKIGDETIIAKCDRTNDWLLGAIAAVLLFAIAVLPGWGIKALQEFEKWHNLKEGWNKKGGAISLYISNIY